VFDSTHIGAAQLRRAARMGKRSAGGTGFYAVARGHAPGVYRSWDECKKQVHGFAGARFRRFDLKECAEAFLAEHGVRSRADAETAVAPAPPAAVDADEKEKVMRSSSDDLFLEAAVVLESVESRSVTSAAVATASSKRRPNHRQRWRRKRAMRRADILRKLNVDVTAIKVKASRGTTASSSGNRF
jgi:hypothetical protein